MSQAARKRNRRQPYAWLGAGAVTLGLGAAMVGGAAVAFADTDAGPAATASDSSAASASGSSAAKETTSSRRKVAIHTSRAAGAPAATRRVSPVPAPSAVVDAAPAAAQTLVQEAAPSHRAPRAQVDHIARLAAVALADAASANIASANVISDPTPSMDSSWLPGGTNGGTTNAGDPIVPGAHVQLALQEIAATRGYLQQATFGSGNVFAGLVSIVPQVFLAGAALSINAWQVTTPAAQGLLAATAGIPILTQISQVTLLSTMLLPALADASMGIAALFVPVVGAFGADVTQARTELASARQDGKIYAVVPVLMKATTEPTIVINVNGGPRTTVLIDSGASGLIVTPDKVKNLDQLTPVGGLQYSGFSGGLDYAYQTYDGAIVDFGNGAVSEPTVINVVTDVPNDPTYENSVANFKEFLAWGADGILGVGANRWAGPGPAPVPTSVLPGELSDGFLLYQNALPFGIGGFMVFGPNLLPTRVSVPGNPDSYLTVKVGTDGTPTTVDAIIDSGGVTGTIPVDLLPAGVTTPVGDQLPAGIRISVYTADGQTLLYSYVTTVDNAPYVVDALDETNTGYMPFNKSPIYINYGYGAGTADYGIGSTDWSIW